MASIRTSPYFNNPAFAQAAQNLASLFAPPDGADAANWATANAKNASSKRLADLFDYAKTAGYDQGQFDREAVAAGLYQPNQSYYSVNTDDATKRRGQDVTAATEIANNQNTVRGAALSQLFQPLNPGQIRPDVPANLAGTIGLPAVGAVAGTPKPLSVDELNAQNQQRLQANGLITDQQLAQGIFGKETPVQAVGPDGRPVFMSPGAAVQTGAQPYVKPDASSKPTNAVAQLPDKTQVAAVQDPTTGRWRNAQTGDELPAGIQIFDLPKATGTAADVGMKTTEAQDRAGYAGVMSEPATNAVISAFNDPAQLPTATDFQVNTLMQQLPAQARVLTGLLSPQGQLFYQNMRSALPYQLMAQSGQAVTEQEYERKMNELVPSPGDSPEVLQAKQRQFIQYQKAIRGMAGPAYEKAGGSALPSTAAPAGIPAPPAPPAPLAIPGPPGAAPTPAPAAEAYPDGTVIQNGAGQKMIRRNGQWAPL